LTQATPTKKESTMAIRKKEDRQEPQGISEKESNDHKGGNKGVRALG